MKSFVIQTCTFFVYNTGQHLDSMNSIVNWSTYEITPETVTLLHREGYSSCNAIKALTDKDLKFLRDKKSMIPGQVSLLRELRDDLTQKSRENQNNNITLPNQSRSLQEIQLQSHPEESAQPQPTFESFTNLTGGSNVLLPEDQQVISLLESLGENLNPDPIVASLDYGSQDNGASDMNLGVDANDGHSETTQLDDVSSEVIGRCSGDIYQDHQPVTGMYRQPITM